MEEFASFTNKTRWELLINDLRSVGKGLWEYKFYLITFINVLVNSGFLEMEERVSVRRILESNDCDTIFSKLQEECEDEQSESDVNYKITNKILKQLEVYNATRDSDNHQKMIQTLDLSNPVSLFDKITQNAIKFGYEAELTRILQNLVIVPNHERQVRNQVWNSMARVANMICEPLRKNMFEVDPLADQQKELDEQNKDYTGKNDTVITMKKGKKNSPRKSPKKLPVISGNEEIKAMDSLSLEMAARQSSNDRRMALSVSENSDYYDSEDIDTDDDYHDDEDDEDEDEDYEDQPLKKVE